MKKIVLMIISVLSLGIILITSCKEDEELNLSDIEGTYIGTYTTTKTELLSKSAPTIEFKNGKFAGKGLSDGGYHDIQNGNFTISDNKIIFELIHIEHDPSVPNIVLMLAPWYDDWLLKGEYELKIDRNKIVFSKTTTVLEEKYKFEFELIKSN